MNWSRHMFLAIAVALSGGLVAGCTHERNGPTLGHYDDFSVRKPKGNTVYVCHSYGCRMQSRVRFTDRDVAEIRNLMKKTAKDDSSAEERRAVAYAIGWIENKVGKEIGTDKDRPGMDFGASGDPTQQDCVDEATNTTTYLLLLDHNGLLKHHSVGTPFAKDDYTRGVAGWTHWTAVLKDKGNGERYAVDSWIYANGENPAIVETSQWYIADLGSLPKSLH
ncbi:MAG: hypothetical protein KDJ37_09945 [Hyphomicrobiaceae bacterium]|nr:hypothetical protein [Hyphomicrobiaceae bacterium]